MARRNSSTAPKDEEFPAYEEFLEGIIWPGTETRAGTSGGYTAVDSEMPQAHAANALAKLVRWARYAPVGETARRADEDVREEYVRTTTLGVHLAARACGMQPEHFHAIYGEVGPGVDAEPRVLLEQVIDIIDARTELDLLPTIELAAGILGELITGYRITERIT